jgi:hypothetical protein
MNELLAEQFFTYEEADDRIAGQICEQSSTQEDLSLLDNFRLFTFPLNQLPPNEDNYGSDFYQCPDCPFAHAPDSKTEKMKLKSGRKRKRQLKDGEKIHDKFAADNILRKIHVHFMSFILSVVNELLNHLEDCPFKFIDIDYKNKKALNKKKFPSLKTQSIGKILCQEVSSKFRKQIKQNLFKNNIIFNQVSKNKIVNDFLSQKYIELFKDYYFSNKRNFNENGVNFQFSEKVKTFENLLSKIEKYDDKDEYKQKIYEVIKKYYFTSILCIKKK